MGSYGPTPDAPGASPEYDQAFAQGGYDQDYGAGYDQAFAQPPAPDGEFGGPGGPGAPAGPTAPPQRRRSMPLIIGGAAVAGLVLVGGGFAVSSMLKDDAKATSSSSSATPKQAAPSAKPSPTVSPLDPVKLKSRTTDPTPLTLGEIFAKRSFSAAGEKYTRVAWNAKRSCTGTVTGTTLTTALKKGGCSQALRATFIRGDSALIGSVGVFNLKTENAAKAAAKTANATKNASLKPLPGPGSTKKIGTGEALGTAESRGHYLVMTWVQRPDGKAIPKASYKAVTAFGRQVIKGSNLAFALAYRETEGKPYKS
jgi:hypothetical protein